MKSIKKITCNTNNAEAEIDRSMQKTVKDTLNKLEKAEGFGDIQNIRFEGVQALLNAVTKHHDKSRNKVDKYINDIAKRAETLGKQKVREGKM